MFALVGPQWQYFPVSASYSEPSGSRSQSLTASPHFMTRTPLCHCQHTPAQILILACLDFLPGFHVSWSERNGKHTVECPANWNWFQYCSVRQQCKPAPCCEKVCPTRWHHQEHVRVMNRFYGLHILVWREVEVGWLNTLFLTWQHCKSCYLRNWFIYWRCFSLLF